MTQEKVYRAGMIPYYVNEYGVVKMLFQRPTDKQWTGDFFQLCKGRVEENEKFTDAALREAKEELGLWEGNILEQYELGVVLGRTSMYLAKVENPAMFMPFDKREVEETRWMTLNEFLNEGRELHKDVVIEAHKKILEREGK